LPDLDLRQIAPLPLTPGGSGANWPRMANLWRRFSRPSADLHPFKAGLPKALKYPVDFSNLSPILARPNVFPRDFHSRLEYKQPEISLNTIGRDHFPIISYFFFLVELSSTCSIPWDILHQLPRCREAAEAPAPFTRTCAHLSNYFPSLSSRWEVREGLLFGSCL